MQACSQECENIYASGYWECEDQWKDGEPGTRHIFPCCDAGTRSSAHNRGFLITLNDRDTLTLYTEGRLVQLTLNVL